MHMSSIWERSPPGNACECWRGSRIHCYRTRTLKCCFPLHIEWFQIFGCWKLKSLRKTRQAWTRTNPTTCNFRSWRCKLSPGSRIPWNQPRRPLCSLGIRYGACQCESVWVGKFALWKSRSNQHLCFPSNTTNYCIHPFIVLTNPHRPGTLACKRFQFAPIQTVSLPLYLSQFWLRDSRSNQSRDCHADTANHCILAFAPIVCHARRLLSGNYNLHIIHISFDCEHWLH